MALVPFTQLEDMLTGFKQSANACGMVEGKNTTYFIDFADGQESTLQVIAKQDVQRGVSLFVALDTPSMVTMAAVTKTVPIVAVAPTYPVASGVVKSLAHSGTNVTGGTDYINPTITIDTMLKVLPNVKTIGMVYNPAEENSAQFQQVIKPALAARGIKLDQVSITGTGDVQQAVKALVGHADAILLGPDNTAISAAPEIAQNRHPEQDPASVLRFRGGRRRRADGSRSQLPVPRAAGRRPGVQDPPARREPGRHAIHQDHQPRPDHQHAGRKADRRNDPVCRPGHGDQGHDNRLRLSDGRHHLGRTRAGSAGPGAAGPGLGRSCLARHQGQRARAGILTDQQISERYADLVILPELTTTPYFCCPRDDRYFEWAEPVPGATTNLFAELAVRHSTTIVLPLFERGADGHFYNAAAVIGPDGNLITGDAFGRPVPHYRKCHVPAVDNPPDTEASEDYYFRPGDALPVFDTPRVRIGVLICFDRWFPEAWRMLTFAGAQLVVVPMVAWGFVKGP